MLEVPKLWDISQGYSCIQGVVCGLHCMWREERVGKSLDLVTKERKPPSPQDESGAVLWAGVPHGKKRRK